jgi:hypothetical protein
MLKEILTYFLLLRSGFRNNFSTASYPATIVIKPFDKRIAKKEKNQPVTALKIFFKYCCKIQRIFL